MTETPKNFKDLDLDDRLLKALSKLGYNEATLIQAEAIPLALKGRDLVAKARTGSGKTAAYCLPIIEKILHDTKYGIRAMILVPSKELMHQVYRNLQEFTAFCSQNVSNYFIDESGNLNAPISTCKPGILVGTPKRLLQFLNKKTINVKESMDFLVIDEADLLLSYGFDEDIMAIKNHLPKTYQTFLMSATLSEDVMNLKKQFVKSPAILKLEENADETNLKHYSFELPTADRPLFLLFLLKLRIDPFGTGKRIIFVSQVESAYRVKLFLEQFGVKTCILNSELPLASRLHIVEEFNRGVYETIILTDNAMAIQSKKAGEVDTARGIDFKDVRSVINYDLPLNVKDYVHRAGRTARGIGTVGFSLTFVPKEEMDTKAGTIVSHIGTYLSGIGQELYKLNIDTTHMEPFRYRSQDAIRSVTKIAVREARLKDLKAEILNSDKLKAHFEDNPQDKEALKHDRQLKTRNVMSHLKHIPDYLMPERAKIKKIQEESGVDTSKAPRVGQKRKRQHHKLKPKAKDPLKTFKKY